MFSLNAIFYFPSTFLLLILYFPSTKYVQKWVLPYLKCRYVHGSVGVWSKRDFEFSREL